MQKLELKMLIRWPCEFCSAILVANKKKLNKCLSIICPVCGHECHKWKNAKHRSAIEHPVKNFVEKYTKPKSPNHIKRSQQMQIRFTAPVKVDRLLKDLQLAFPGSSPEIQLKGAENEWGDKFISIEGITQEKVLELINAHRKALAKEAQALTQISPIEKQSEKPSVEFPDDKNENCAEISRQAWQNVAAKEHDIIEAIATRVAVAKDGQLLQELTQVAEEQQSLTTKTIKAVRNIENRLQEASKKVTHLETANEKLIEENKKKDDKILLLEKASDAKAKALADLRKDISNIETKIKVISGEKLPDLEKVIGTLERMKQALL